MIVIIITILIVLVVLVALGVQYLARSKFNLSESKSELIGFLTFFVVSIIVIFLFDALYTVPMRNAEILEMLNH